MLSSGAMTRRAVVGSARRTVTGGATADDAVGLDDRPLSLTLTRDGKRLLVALPYEIWVLHAETLEVERAIELASPRPTPFDADDEGTLWIGGTHLYRGSVWSSTATKFGTKLGGFVDRVCLLRPRLVCGIGSNGEVLLDTEKEDVIHRRKAPEHDVLALVPSPDGRAVWIDGSNFAWVIDPEHPSGYMKLKLKQTSSADVPGEAIVALGITSIGQCVLAARDGAVAWTNRALRPLGERIPIIELRNSTPLGIAGDERWIYVLRPLGVLHRFLVAQPPPDPSAKNEPPPLPEAQSAKLPRHAQCIAMVQPGVLALAGAHADDQLGRVWRERIDDLPWTDLRLGKRNLVDSVPAPEDSPKAPSFERTRSKLSGAPLEQLRVDDVVAPTQPFWITRTTGVLLERPVDVRNADEVLPNDALLLPAMIRVQEGTARPALLLWPGTASELIDPESVEWITWGDRPRGWIPLATPEIRAQGWSRRGVFPLQVALAGRPPQVAGRRPSIPGRWADAELFAAMVKECKHLLKVLW